MKTLVLNHKQVILILLAVLLIYGTHGISYAQVCKVGDTLSPGDSCTYPGTNIEFSVLNDGSGRFLFITAGTGINARNITVNGVRYNFAASKQADGTWLIEAAGDGGTTPPPPAQKPDLVIESVQAVPATVDPGQEFRLYATLRNNGTQVSAATTVRYYSSIDNVISTQDTQLAGASRNPLAANATIRRYLGITAPTTPGTYYYGVCVDSVPNEGNTDNNCSAAVSITVEQATDPTASAGETTYESGEDIPTLPTGFWTPDLLSGGASYLFSGGQITMEFNNGGLIEEGGITYTCVAAGGCRIEGRRVTQGTIQVSGTQQPSTPEQPGDTSGTTTLTASTSSPLTEATLHEGGVTLTLSSGTYVRSRIDIGNALTVSGIDGVTIGTFGPAWFGVDRISDTEITVELGFSGNIDTDTTLTFTIGADAIANYNGPALTAQVPVTAATEWVVASTAAPLTGATLDESIVTLTLSGGTYERWSSNIRNAVTVSGIDGVTIDTFGVDRVSDSQITVELAFDGNNPNGTLTFTIGAGAIANYDGPALTAQLSVPTRLKEGENGDVNGDGAVSIQDLMLVTSSFGQTGQHPADVNGDGTVDIKDLIVIAGVLDTNAAAPSLQPYSLEMLTAADVRQWLSQAQHLNLIDATSQRGIIFLENLLKVLSPKETTLLPNYPNPFNPETWIPYHLANDSDVLLSIYDINGALVRELDLGYQLAGYYSDRSRAAYWDGRNGLGERVASGIYFYQLRADGYSQMRKMVILK